MKEQVKHYQKMPLTQNFQNVKCLTYGGHLLHVHSQGHLLTKVHFYCCHTYTVAECILLVRFFIKYWAKIFMPWFQTREHSRAAGVGDTRIFGPDSDTDTLSNTGPIPRPILMPGMGTIRFQYRFWPFLGDSETYSILATASRFLHWFPSPYKGMSKNRTARTFCTWIYIKWGQI